MSYTKLGNTAVCDVVAGNEEACYTGVGNIAVCEAVVDNVAVLIFEVCIVKVEIVVGTVVVCEVNIVAMSDTVIGNRAMECCSCTCSCSCGSISHCICFVTMCNVVAGDAAVWFCSC